MFKFLDTIQAFKFGRASRQNISGNQCVACNSRDLTIIGQNAYQCNKCGYEGGEGIAAAYEANRLRKFDSLTLEERRKSAREDLIEARRTLLAGIGSLANAHEYSIGDSTGFGGMDDSEKFSDFADGLEYVFKGQALLRDAWYKLEGHPQGPIELDIPIDFTGWALDVNFDNIISDVRSTHQIHHVHAYAKQMLFAAEQALTDAFAVPAENTPVVASPHLAGGQGVPSVGERVLAQYAHNCYEATVAQLDDSGILIDWDDGTRSRVLYEEVKPSVTPSISHELRPGQRVMARFNDIFYASTVGKVANDRVYIKWDDNTESWVSLSEIRLI